MKKNNPKKQTEAKNILDMIRAKQEDPEQGNKLRAFLNNLHDDGTVEENYSETPIYRMGFSDGQEEGYDKGYNDAYYELYNVLKAVETLIEPHIKDS